MKHTKSDLKQMQSLPLSAKIRMTERRIMDWYEHYNGQVYVSFSGGKDSTVLLHIARNIYPDIEAVFVNTGLEYPEIQKFVKTFDNVTILRPEMRFDEVIKKYGYPMISKSVANAIDGAKKSIKKGVYSLRLRLLGVKPDEYGGLIDSGKYDYEKAAQGSKYESVKYRPLLDVDFRISDVCCNVMKKTPAYDYQKKTRKKPILATMASESMLREKSWFKNGCNAFKSKQPHSAPMSFWTEQDIYQYIKQFNVPIASVYGEVVCEENAEQMRLEDYGVACGGTEKLVTTGCSRTGCIFCGFGCHLDKGLSRFETLKQTHPRQYEYCIGGGEYDENGVWKPNKQGLGMGHVFDELNKIYGEDFIKY